MSVTSQARIAELRSGSPAAEAGLVPGDRLLRVNGKSPRDYIEYRYLIAEEAVSLTVAGVDGKCRRVRIAKPLDADLGITFTSDVFDGVRTCRNRCSFCFLAQLPAGLRPALYVRDDDYRLSFLHGNFITLTNLTAADRTRIARVHLSPLYVSVHATEPDVRARLFGCATPEPRREMRHLISRGIEFHAQIVVCPGVNDGPHLERTVRDLAGLHPGVRSIGIVPVGLTRHRRGLPPIRPVRAKLATELVQHVRGWQTEFVRESGSRLVFAADELYRLAGIEPPPRAQYDGSPQLGNGIGGVRLFLDEIRRMRPPRLRRRLRLTLVTGEGAAALVRMLEEKLEAGGSVRAEVRVIRNRLLGRSVTTAGLLAGRDVARALRGSDVGELVLVPAAAVREGEGFLDGMTLEELSRSVCAPVLPADSPREALAVLRRFAADRCRPWA